MGVPEFSNPLGLPPCRQACLLVIDGLGWEGLWANQDEAPFLASLLPSGRTITTGFPSTTAASVASIGTGMPPGEHGLVGFTMALPGHAHAMNVLRWTVYGTGRATDLSRKLQPERLQPRATALEIASQHGVEVTLIGPAIHEHSGLSRAALRGGRFLAAVSAGDLAGRSRPSTSSVCCAPDSAASSTPTTTTWIRPAMCEASIPVHGASSCDR